VNLRQFWSNPWHPELGFSGTREGMTLKQGLMVSLLFKALEPSSFHHGAGIGADDQAHFLARGYSGHLLIHTHPCNLTKYQTAKYQTGTPGDFTHPVKPPLERNHDIVDASDIMLFTPKEDQPVLRSGTWATFRYALSLNKPMVLIKPNGESIFYDGGKVIMKTNVAALRNSTGAATFTVNTLDTGTALAIEHTNDGYFCFYASGTFGSGTAKLQVSPDDTGTVWLDVTGASLTADGYKVCQVFGRRVRGVLSGNTSATVTMKLAGITTGLVLTNS
jgi:hypothetical protein